jgi:hypothetical protein
MDQQDEAVNQEVEQEQTVAPEQESQAEKPESKVPDWATKRFGELTAARKEAERRAAQLQQELENYRSQGEQQQEGGHQPHPNVEALAQMYAERLVDERLKAQTFNQSIQAIESAGKTAYGDEFDRSIQNLQMAGVGGQEFLQVLAAIPNPEKLIHWMGRAENMEEALRIASLPGYQMAIEMTKAAPRAAKEVSKSFSKAPPPINPIDGGGGGSGQPKVGTPEWFAWRNENARRK